MTQTYRFSVLALGLLFTTLLGCGGDHGTRQSVSGEVKLKGAPLDKGTIMFSPKKGGPGTMSGAEIKDGKYQVPRESGLEPGVYDVRITSAGDGPAVDAAEMPGVSGPPAKERIPADYNTNTKLELTVEADKASVFNADIP
ncbi:MAG: hypothetical protein U0939_24600 [Pirellulales bacterium]